MPPTDAMLTIRPPLPEQFGKRGGDRVVWAPEVGRERPLVILGRRVFERAGHDHAGVVDEDVDPTVMVDDVLDEILDLLRRRLRRMARPGPPLRGSPPALARARFSSSASRAQSAAARLATPARGPGPDPTRASRP